MWNIHVSIYVSEYPDFDVYIVAHLSKENPVS